MSPLDQLPPPPIPQRLHEMLKDYPELVQTLQEHLNSVVMNPAKAIPPFEVAVWTLQDTLSGFLTQAREELETAKDSGDSAAIEQADKKERLMSFARASGGGMRDLSDLQAYFQTLEGAAT